MIVCRQTGYFIVEWAILNSDWSTNGLGRCNCTVFESNACCGKSPASLSLVTTGTQQSICYAMGQNSVISAIALAHVITTKIAWMLLIPVHIFTWMIWR